MAFHHPPTARGYPVYEVISAAQKEIRRSNPDAATYWIVELDLSSHTAWAWSRLKTICAEDVGPGAPGVPADLAALYDFWKASKSKTGGMWLIHATILLAQAPKNRVACLAALTHGSDRMERREVPDYAIDAHTARGKRMGRGHEHFASDGAKVIAPHVDLTELEDSYRALFKRVRESDPTLPDNPWEGRADRGQLRLGGKDGG